MFYCIRPYSFNSANGWSAAACGAVSQLYAYDEPVESRSVCDDGPRRARHLVEPYG